MTKRLCWIGLAVAVLLTPAALADVCRGDADCSGSVNFDDINYFVSALAGGEPGWSGYYLSRNGCLPPCTYANCDADGNGSVNFDDINPFVSLLVTPPVCAAVPGWPCPPPTGACCHSDGTCMVTLQADCTPGCWTLGGTCEPNICQQPYQGYANDFSSLAHLSTRAPLGPPYLNPTWAPITAVSTDTPAGSSGYLYFDIWRYGPPCGVPFDLSMDNEVTLTWRFDTPSPGTGTMTAWLRVYCGTWNGTAWVMKNRADYSFTAPVNGGWSTIVKDFEHPQGLYYPLVPWDPTHIYQMRIDTVYWDAALYAPNTITFDDLSFTRVPGACCLPDGSCDATLTGKGCAAAGGTYNGNGTPCEAVTCPQPEACCIGTDCVLLAPFGCTAQGGTPAGQPTCDPNPCIPVACCFADGHCAMLPPANCVAQGGNPWYGYTCEPTNPCPQPTGACCRDCVCTEEPEANCVATGGVWKGALTYCDPNPCLASLGIVFYHPMDHQVNHGSGDLFSFFDSAGTNGVDGYLRNDLPLGGGAGGYYDGPWVWFSTLPGGKIDVTGATIAYTARYFQGGDNTNPYGDAPIFPRLHDANGAECDPINPYFVYPTWKAVQFAPCGGIDATKLTRFQIWGTDWAGLGQDFTMTKDLLIYTGAAPTGACCLPDGTCLPALVTMMVCVNDNGGMWMGPCSTCATVICLELPGACCFADGHCELVLEANCPLDGSFHGRDTECMPYEGHPNYPCSLGACCMPTGCTVMLSDLCLAQGGSPGPDGSTCDPNPCPPNDLCANAQLVAVPSQTAGDTTLATLSDAVPAGCCDVSGTVDVWYTLVGNGFPITVDTCASMPTWDSQIAVYTGTCDSLTCVGCNDDFNDCISPPGWTGLSSVTFDSVKDTAYIVRVFGWDYQVHKQGPFILTVTTAVPTGACCRGTACTVEPEANCVVDGTYQGNGTDCFPNPCTTVHYWMDTATGEQGPAWIPYPSGWINAWWPNEFDLTRQKLVELVFTVQFAGAAPTVAVNYSRMDWPDPVYPPSIDEYVIRIPVDPPVILPGEYTFSTPLPFCPLWVSVDVMNNGGDFTIEGTIVHVCLP